MPYIRSFLTFIDQQIGLLVYQYLYSFSVRMQHIIKMDEKVFSEGNVDLCISEPIDGSNATHPPDRVEAIVSLENDTKSVELHSIRSTATSIQDQDDPAKAIEGLEDVAQWVGPKDQGTVPMVYLSLQSFTSQENSHSLQSFHSLDSEKECYWVSQQALTWVLKVYLGQVKVLD